MFISFDVAGRWLWKTSLYQTCFKRYFIREYPYRRYTGGFFYAHIWKRVVGCLTFMPPNYILHNLKPNIMQREPSQFIGQVKDQIYPIIERLNEEKQQNITSLNSKRWINKAVQHFESGLDLIEKALLRSKGQKRMTQDVSNGERQHRQQSYRRQTQETT
jgi:hypothetical protein